MAEKPKPNPEEEEGNEDEETQTPKTSEEGTEGEQTPKKPPTGEGLPPKPVDYKTKFSESTRENQRILEEAAELKRKNAELEDQLEESQRTLSDRELKEKYPNWEFMDEEERKKAQEDLEKEKRLKILEAKEKWRDDYRKLTKETKEKIEAKGGEEAFKDFACSPENVGQKNLENLAKQFLYEEPKPETPPVEPEKKPGLEPGIGGPKTPFTPKKGYTAEEAAEMRKKDARKYNKLVAEGRMNII